MTEPPAPWYQRPLQVTLVGIIAAAAITAAGASVSNAISSATLENRADASDRAIGELRGTGDAVANRLATLESDSRNDRRILLRLEDKMDVLLQRQFGAVPN